MKYFSYPEIEMVQRRLPTKSAVAEIFVKASIADISSFMTPENRLAHFPGDILQVGETEINPRLDHLSAVRSFGASMDERDIHRTSFVGECYSYESDSRMWTVIPQYEKEEAAAGHFRIFATYRGNIGISSDKIEKNDLLCFIDTHKIGFVIRRLKPWSQLHHSPFLLIGQVVMLDPEFLVTHPVFHGMCDGLYLVSSGFQPY